MRVVRDLQMKLGETSISQIKFDLRSRDDIPKILRGLQHLYMNEELRQKVFALLEKEIAPEMNKRNGRPGMTLWNILVCGVLRLDLNADYDRLLELVNQHQTLRQMLGHSLFDEGKEYAYQTLVDNVGLLTPELLDKLNQVIVEGGHALVKKGDAALRGRCDSFVVETNVHFPTDLRKGVRLNYWAMIKLMCHTHKIAWLAFLDSTCRISRSTLCSGITTVSPSFFTKMIIASISNTCAKRWEETIAGFMRSYR